MSVLDLIEGGLVVSCQALEDEPLHSSEIMARMAKAAAEGGAVGIRANGPSDIKAIKETVDLPLIGLYKNMNYQSNIYITPTFAEAKAVFTAGADIIAIDATNRIRPQEVKLTDFVKKVKKELGALIMGDISTLEEGMAAEKAGIDLVGTTLSGYTEYTQNKKGPDFDLLKKLVNKLTIPVIMEGKVNSPQQVKKALSMGAHAVVVGTAITRPQVITARFVEAITS